MKKIGIIPARYDSTRLPGKPLADINGKPMIQWVYENSIKSNLDRVIVATDDKRVYDVVIDFGGEAMMTSKNHENGSSRLVEVVKQIDADIIVNIQGDEPLIDDEIINEVINGFENDENVVTLKTLIEDEDEINNPNVVKVITDINDKAIVFSRIALPYKRNEMNIKYYKHIGIYGYKKEFLMKYIKLNESTLEKAESLEQLRIIENGYSIKVLEITKELIGVDTIEDLEKVRMILK